jgi:hypothetical protein
MKKYIFGNHQWLEEWITEYHLEKLCDDDIRLKWLLFKLTKKDNKGGVYRKISSYFKSYGIKVTKNKKKQLVFHIDQKMKTWIILTK